MNRAQSRECDLFLIIGATFLVHISLIEHIQDIDQCIDQERIFHLIRCAQNEVTSL